MEIPGVLALQGGFAAHKKTLENLGYSPVLVRNNKDLDRIDRLIIPGGESTVMIRLLNRYGLKDPLLRRIRSGMPVFGTCAGMILLSSGISDSNQETLGLMDFHVKRNAYGRQIASFETELTWEGIHVPALFIRAPQICKYGSDVEVLLRHEESPVLVKQDRLLAASFHPELTDSKEFHKYFMDY